MIDIEDKRQKVIDLIKQKGPVLPVHISGELGMNSLFSSAILSEMVSSKLLKLSGLKVGGSPLYFLAGQESMLENFSKFLGGKEKETFELLKKNLVLQDDKIAPADRIAIRSLKDFAFSFKVNTDEGEKLFWKFYSINNDEAIKKINILIKKTPLKQKYRQEKEIKEIKEKKVIKKEKQEEIKHEEKEQQIKEESDLLDKVSNYLKENKIDILQEKLKKKKELEFTVLAPSSFGKIQMLLISKDKKSISDADLSLAFSQAQTSKLPVLFLHTGKLTKRAEIAIENFKNSLFLRQL